MAAQQIALLPRASIEPLVAYVDGYLDEQHRLSVNKTEFPVESGAQLTDHAVRQPTKLTLTGWTSDVLRAAEADQGVPALERAAIAWAAIERLVAAREPVDVVVTLLGTYPSMLITSATAPVSADTGRALRFTLELEEVQLVGVTVEAGRLEPHPSIADRVGEENRGRVEATPTSQDVS